MKLDEELIAIKQTITQISTLSEIYDSLVNSRPSKQEAEQKRIEAEYARDQILKLSLHVKHKLQEIERKEAIK